VASLKNSSSSAGGELYIFGIDIFKSLDATVSSVFLRTEREVKGDSLSTGVNVTFSGVFWVIYRGMSNIY